MPSDHDDLLTRLDRLATFPEGNASRAAARDAAAALRESKVARERAERLADENEVIANRYSVAVADAVARAERAEQQLAAITDVALDAVAYIDTFKHTRPDRGAVASEFGDMLRALLDASTTDAPNLTVTVERIERPIPGGRDTASDTPCPIPSAHTVQPCTLPAGHEGACDRRPDG